MANKLELTWYGKDEPIVVEPRLLRSLQRDLRSYNPSNRYIVAIVLHK